MGRVYFTLHSHVDLGFRAGHLDPNYVRQPSIWMVLHGPDMASGIDFRSPHYQRHHHVNLLDGFPVS